MVNRERLFPEYLYSGKSAQFCREIWPHSHSTQLKTRQRFTLLATSSPGGLQCERNPSYWKKEERKKNADSENLLINLAQGHSLQAVTGLLQLDDQNNCFRLGGWWNLLDSCSQLLITLARLGISFNILPGYRIASHPLTEKKSPDKYM